PPLRHVRSSWLADHPVTGGEPPPPRRRSARITPRRRVALVSATHRPARPGGPAAASSSGACTIAPPASRPRARATRRTDPRGQLPVDQLGQPAYQAVTGDGLLPRRDPGLPHRPWWLQRGVDLTQRFGRDRHDLRRGPVVDGQFGQPPPVADERLEHFLPGPR